MYWIRGTCDLWTLPSVLVFLFTFSCNVWDSAGIVVSVFFCVGLQCVVVLNLNLLFAKLCFSCSLSLWNHLLWLVCPLPLTVYCVNYTTYLFLQATFDCLLKTYGFLTPEFWKETRFSKSPFQEYTDLLAKPTGKTLILEEERVEAWVLPVIFVLLHNLF